jgi:hypothetical protein
MNTEEQNMVNFFYFSVKKLPEQMSDDELIQEIQSAISYSERCRMSGQGVNAKEHVRQRNCEIELVKRPGGLDKWTEEIVNFN